MSFQKKTLAVLFPLLLVLMSLKQTARIAVPESRAPFENEFSVPVPQNNESPPSILNTTTTKLVEGSSVGKDNVTSSASDSMTRKQDSSSKVRSSNKTIIVGFADHLYKDIAFQWYQELEQLGYTEHLVAAQDRMTATYFADQNVRHDLVSPKSNISLSDDCHAVHKKKRNTKQIYRRSMFGSRWHYILKKLEQGYNVLTTDVDNLWVRHIDMTELEDSPFDAYHAYAGLFNEFPVKISKKYGFTICGGMSWLRSTPGVIEFVRSIVSQCGCTKLGCNCFCDDQVVINTKIHESEFKIQWDANITIPQSAEEVSWEGQTGTCTKTGHRVKIWDRHVMYRNNFVQQCPDPIRNWVSMPTGVDKKNMRTLWQQKCGNETNVVE